MSGWSSACAPTTKAPTIDASTTTGTCQRCGDDHPLVTGNFKCHQIKCCKECLPEVIKLKEGCPTTCIEDPAEALAAMNI
jgi:hypothetical protein